MLSQDELLHFAILRRKLAPWLSFHFHRIRLQPKRTVQQFHSLFCCTSMITSLEQSIIKSIFLPLTHPCVQRILEITIDLRKLNKSRDSELRKRQLSFFSDQPSSKYRFICKGQLYTTSARSNSASRTASLASDILMNWYPINGPCKNGFKSCSLELGELKSPEGCLWLLGHPVYTLIQKNIVGTCEGDQKPKGNSLK